LPSLVLLLNPLIRVFTGEEAMQTSPGLGRALRSLAAVSCVLTLAAVSQGEQAPQPAPVQPPNTSHVPPQKQFADTPTTHEKVAEVSVKSTDGKYRLQTVSIDKDGRVLALAAPPKSFGPPVK